MSKTSEFQRLPNVVVPKHYKIRLQPNLTAFTFAGQVSINIDIVSPIESIILNSIDLKIKTASVVLDDAANPLASTKITFSLEQETVELNFGRTLPIGQGVLSIDFDGELNDKMKGFYRSKYFTAAGEERYSAVTQFATTDARRCFPCWDEPAIKATFDITLIVPVDRIGLSNMPIISTARNADGLTVLTFSTTPIMSTYLVAFVVGEYDYVEATSEDGVLVRVYTPVGKREQGSFALEVAAKVLPYYKDYFDIAYPLPKMDLIAIADLAYGAMENWGLITYREQLLLVDPENTSLMSKQSIALTVGHEIAHQWFGNLVTMEWWTHLWLNEGYASFVEFLCVNKLFPDYDIWTQFVTDMHITALELDCLDNSHPIEVPVGHPAEINEIFDEISYNKGASIIRMLHNYLGDEDFRKGMNIYLTRHQYKNSQTEDLWRALEEASHKSVTSVMSKWTQHKGFPVVHVASHQDQTKRVLKLNQKIFTAHGGDSKETHFWLIPINLSTKSNSTTTTTALLGDKELTIELQDVAASDWIKVNCGSIGYYRTSYSPEMLNSFNPSILDQTLPPLDRLALIDDLFATVQSGLASTDQVLRLIEAYRSETNYTVWSSITNSLVKLQILLSHTDLGDKFDAYGTRLYKPIFDKLGWNARPNENHFDTLLRSLVLNRLVSFNCLEILAESYDRYKLHVSGEVLLVADLRSACYKAALKKSDKTFEELLKLYRATDSHEELNRIAIALGSSSDESLLRKVIDFAMSHEVRAQDSVFILGAVAINPLGRNIVWEFFKENSAKLFDRYEGGVLLARLVKCLTENFATEERAADVQEFFRLNEYPGTERTVRQSIEMIRLNANWLHRDLASLVDYFAEF